jgi:hypothetical protein
MNLRFILPQWEKNDNNIHIKNLSEKENHYEPDKDCNIESVYEQLGIPKKNCIRIVESLFDISKDDLEKGNDIMISGFGKWTVKVKKRTQRPEPSNRPGSDH